MSLIKPKPPIPTPIDPVKVEIVGDGYRGVTVDSAVTPLANIIQYVEGSTWEVEYYSQVLDHDSEPQPQQLNRAAAYQQYIRIKGLELKVTSPLAPSHDSESGSMVVEGSAMIPTTSLIPSKGDCFLADIGQGREAQLTITEVSRKTHYKQSLYAINYEVVRYSDHDVSAIRADLKRKVVKEVSYVRDHNYLGVNPLMLDEALNVRIEMQRLYSELVKYFFSDFYSYGYRMLLIPDQQSPAYDPFLNHEILKWVEVDDAPQIIQMDRPRVTTGFGRIPETVWSALSKSDYGLLRNCVQKTGLLHRSYFRTVPDLAGFFYAGVDHCVYPLGEFTEVDAGYRVNCTPAAYSTVLEGKLRFSNLERLTAIADLDGLYYSADLTAGELERLPHVAPVSRSGYYVFSENFYTGNGNLASNLERLIYQQLKHDTIDTRLLVDVAKTAMFWDNLERFYYIPVLLALLKTAIRIN